MTKKSGPLGTGISLVSENQNKTYTKAVYILYTRTFIKRKTVSRVLTIATFFARPFVTKNDVKSKKS